MKEQGGLQIRSAEECAWDQLSLGEVMLRFDPGEDRITRTRHFRVWEGGGEYNVARGLRRCFGMRTSLVTALADNPVGRLLEDMMLQGGVDLSHLRWLPYDGVGEASRNGVYFLERGYGNRPAMGMMDRGHTPISQMKPGEVDWDRIFGKEGVRWFHTGGIMCALSLSATEVVREAMTSARRHGVVISYDCNYRPSLWKRRGGRLGAAAVNRELAPLVDVLLGHDGDLAREIGASSQGPPWHDEESYAAMAKGITEDFPNIKVIATTARKATSANRNHWGAFGWSEGEVYRGMHFEDLEIFDRVGGGDSFAAGVFYGLLSGRGMQWSLDCGVAHGALAMTTPGDNSMFTLAEVEHAMSRNGAGVQR
ncbi:sugar kinase, ribokinase [Terriglobus roseus DSM 18391]|uniref:Sugar kinase, ribokinase n=2 Tax=Terriglobus roseus TaxID=392734 RepID=I3ZMJ5_TERRK|nr:sugar kinase [Terriglobus roseus]AFL90463.1 sugar kinase, ribokinase [Terriglobus roseus DSM 18391]